MESRNINWSKSSLKQFNEAIDYIALGTPEGFLKTTNPAPQKTAQPTHNLAIQPHIFPLHFTDICG